MRAIHGEHRQIERRFTEQRIAYLIQNASGAVTRNNMLRLRQPFRAGLRADSQAQIAAAARQVERELGLITSVDPERRIVAVERPVKKLGTILDDEIRALRAIAQWAGCVSREQGPYATISFLWRVLRRRNPLLRGRLKAPRKKQRSR